MPAYINYTMYTTPCFRLLPDSSVHQSGQLIFLFPLRQKATPAHPRLSLDGRETSTKQQIASSKQRRHIICGILHQMTTRHSNRGDTQTRDPLLFLMFPSVCRLGSGSSPCQTGERLYWPIWTDERVTCQCPMTLVIDHHQRDDGGSRHVETTEGKG